jgi:L-serine deaminase
MKKSKGKSAGKRGKKKYSAPKMVRHGNLDTVADRIAGTVSIPCCVTQRIRASKSDAASRGSLLTDLARAHAAR